MIKFPNKLSKERLSLLSPEDKKIYEYEHSGLCPEMRYLTEPEIILNANIKHLEEDISFKLFMEEITYNNIFDDVFDKELIEAVGEDEYKRIRKELFDSIENDPDLIAMNEAEGHDITYWLPNMGWLGKLSASLLTGLVGLLAWLFMKGMDRLAMMKLKKYMNKLVELTDQGVNKKRPWYSFLCPTKKGKQNIGDYDKACFRTIQETAERNMACLYSLAIHNLGFLNSNANNFNEVTSGYPADDSGLATFKNIINGAIDNFEGIQLSEGLEKLIPTKINTDYFNNLQLPAVPTNYKMLMSNIDYPTKANKNPNGSLFMKPTEEILKAKGEDLGSLFFHPDNKNIFKDVIVIGTSKNESFYNERNSMLRALFEIENEEGLDKTLDGDGLSPLTDDTAPTEVAGAEIETEINPRESTAVKAFNGNIIDAIDGYVAASVPGITKLIRGICGQKDLKEFATLLTTLNNASEGNITKFFKKKDNDAVLHLIIEDDYLKTILQLRNFRDVVKNIIRVSNWSMNANFAKKAHISKRVEFQEKLLNLSSDTDTTDKELNDVLSSYTGDILSNYSDAKKLANTLGLLGKTGNNSNNINTSIQYDFKYVNKLYEDELIKNALEIRDSLRDSMETSYKHIRDRLHNAINTIIEAQDTNEWQVIKEAKERMTKLKEAADKEITTKIELICRTANTGNADIGDKFKSALSKHPLRAASLTNIWARYSDDLTGRIETRIKNITGDNGASNIFTTIKTFLNTTYPNLIALMLYYKSIFFLVRLYTSKYPINPDSVKAMDDENTDADIDNLQELLNILRAAALTQQQLQQPAAGNPTP